MMRDGCPFSGSALSRGQPAGGGGGASPPAAARAARPSISVQRGRSAALRPRCGPLHRLLRWAVVNRWRASGRGSALLLPAAIALLPTAGCGVYTLGYRAPPSVHTIAVPIFDNATFPLRRDVEYELTSAVRREIQSRTPLSLVAEEEADLVVYGKVSSFRERVIAEGRQDEKLESNIYVSVDLVVEDRVQRQRWKDTVTKVEPFSIARGETIDQARRRAIENLAEKILIALDRW
ncbi:MAG: LptE family protein [Planctomycetes bacterium]|nr:LptE family protein [Planctomycetota bacterium]